MPVECKFGMECRNIDDAEHCKEYFHRKKMCRWGESCRQKADERHCKLFQHPGDDAAVVEVVAGDDAAHKEIVEGDDAVPPPPSPHPHPFRPRYLDDFGRRKCRHGAACLSTGDPRHKELFFHPGDEDPLPSQEDDAHTGTKYPHKTCKDHPGCRRRYTCFESHGRIMSRAEKAKTCFLGQEPFNAGCHNPIPADSEFANEPYAFCSAMCAGEARRFRKDPVKGCRRKNCRCPCTINGKPGQYCCEACRLGRACEDVTHVLPQAYVFVVPEPRKGKYAPCAREGCACAAEEGSSWDGKEGSYCCKACRKGTPCTMLWHTVPEDVMAKAREDDHPYRGNPCALPGCDKPTSSETSWVYCSLAHQGKDKELLKQKEKKLREELESMKEEHEKLYKEALAGESESLAYSSLYCQAAQWVRAASGGAQGGPVTSIYMNKSLACSGCPARVMFQNGVNKTGVTEFSDGEFGWHGTKSKLAIEAICWGSFDTARRSGQVYGPGEYFSRGTTAGLNYSESYAGGDAANYLIVAWIVSGAKGGQSHSDTTNANKGTIDASHIVCHNPMQTKDPASDIMYCLPVAVVCFSRSAPQEPTWKIEGEANRIILKAGDSFEKLDHSEGDVAKIEAQMIILFSRDKEFSDGKTTKVSKDLLVESIWGVMSRLGFEFEREWDVSKEDVDVLVAKCQKDELIEYDIFIKFVQESSEGKVILDAMRAWEKE